MPEQFYRSLQATSELVMSSSGMVIVAAVYAGLVLVAVVVGTCLRGLLAVNGWLWTRQYRRQVRRRQALDGLVEEPTRRVR